MKNTIGPLPKPSKRKKSGGFDLELNLSLTNVLIRFGVVFLLPIVAMLIDRRIVVYTVPLCMYLLMTSMLKFCPIKYVWQRYVNHESALHHEYGKDPNYPDESI